MSLLSPGVNETALLREPLSQIRKGLIGAIIFLSTSLSCSLSPWILPLSTSPQKAHRASRCWLPGTLLTTSLHNRLLSCLLNVAPRSQNLKAKSKAGRKKKCGWTKCDRRMIFYLICHVAFSEAVGCLKAKLVSQQGAEENGSSWKLLKLFSSK